MTLTVEKIYTNIYDESLELFGNLQITVFNTNYSIDKLTIDGNGNTVIDTITANNVHVVFETLTGNVVSSNTFFSNSSPLINYTSTFSEDLTLTSRIKCHDVDKRGLVVISANGDVTFSKNPCSPFVTPCGIRTHPIMFTY
jgi:hypothetical protein